MNNHLPFARPVIGEEEKKAVLAALCRPQLTEGPEAAMFEEEFATFVGAGAHTAVAVSSCTAALHLSLMAFGIGPGDEVIVPAMTHAATVHAVELVGAKPIFVDAGHDDGNMPVAMIGQKIGPRTKAVMIVHFLGVPCDMPALRDLLRGRGIYLIEDCALALGVAVDGTHVGLWGDAGCFSFYPAKHMTSAEGGMILTRHAGLADKLRSLRAFGKTLPIEGKPVPFDVTQLGLNYRMSELHAALGRVQLARAWGFLEARNRNLTKLRALFRNRLIMGGHYALSVFVQQGRDRDKARAKMLEMGLETSVYYPVPVPLLTYYRKKYETDPQAYPVARWISDKSVALPLGPHIRPEHLSSIARIVGEVLK